MSDTPQGVSVDSDTFTAEFHFNDPSFPALTVDNFTSYTLESDFFTPCDSFHLVIEDDRATQLSNKIQIGTPLVLKVNDAPQLIGQVDKISLSYSPESGSQLHLHGRDKLGLMADATCNPNLYYGADTTIREILTDLFTIFDITIDENSLSDATLLSVATAGLVGTANRAKTPSAIVKSWLRSINHQTKPNKEEGYLQYAMRLCRELGLNIKLIPGTTTVFVNTPIYDRDHVPLYSIVSRGNLNSTVINATLEADWSRQPSAIVAEMAGGQNPTFRRELEKVLQVNEITGFDADGNIQEATQTILAEFQDFGYNQVPVNDALRDSLPSLLSTQPDIGLISRPSFLFDEHATNLEELQFFVMHKMAEAQKEFLTLSYELKDHTYRKPSAGSVSFPQRFVWNVNQMVNVEDNRFGIGGENYWIRKRMLTKSAMGGTKTQLVLNLPYIFNFYATA